MKKLINYVGTDSEIIKQVENYEIELLRQLSTTNVHISDVINWLYMLPINYPQKFSIVAFDLIEKHFEKPEVREFLKSQRSLPALIKSILYLIKRDL